MQQIKKFIEILNHHIFFIFILLVISFISHSYLFFDRNYLNWGDWIHVPNASLITMYDFKLWLGYYNFGDVMFFPNNLPFYWLASYLYTQYGINWDLFTRIVFLFPIIFFTPVSFYIFIKKIIDSPFICFITTSVYSFNTFFLKLQLDWLTYAYIWWILPLVVYCYLSYDDTEDPTYLIYNSILVGISFIFEIRIAIILLVFISLFIFLKNLTNIKSIKYKKIVLYFGSIAVAICLNLFWILPFSSSISSDVMSLASESVFTPFFSLAEVITLKSYQWTGNLIYEAFNIQKVETRFYLLPLIILLGVLLINVKKNKIFLTLFSLYLIFVFLAKQNNPPFGFIYVWLFKYIPLFNMYRESSKFIIIVAFTSSTLLGYCLFEINNFLRSRVKLIFRILMGIVFVFIVSIYNLENFINGEIGGMTKGVSIDKNLQAINDMIEQDKEFSRILWIPVKPRFGTFSLNHPAIDGKYLKDYVYKNKLCIENNSAEYLNSISFYSYCNRELLKKLSVKYVVIIPEEEIVKSTGPGKSEKKIEIYEYFKDQGSFIYDANKNNFLKKQNLDSVNNGMVYLNKDINSRITIYNNEFEMNIDNIISNSYTDFEFKINNLNSINKINFNEKYHPDWELTINDKILPKNYLIKNELGLNTFEIDKIFLSEFGSNPNLKITFNSDNKLDRGIILTKISLFILAGIYLVLVIKKFVLFVFKNYISKFRKSR
jgi:hypothetical protein